MGNWFDRTKPLDEQLLGRTSMMEGGKTDDDEGTLSYFDTIVADYLIGAMDRFSPYMQDFMIPKLVRLLKPGGRLYILGFEPIPETSANNNKDVDIICQVRQIRDACILLAGRRRPYREYPSSWVQRQIKENNPDLTQVTLKVFPNRYSHAEIVQQIDVARRELPYFPTVQLADEMKSVLDNLEQHSYNALEQNGSRRVPLGYDYVVVAEKNKIDANDEKASKPHAEEEL